MYCTSCAATDFSINLEINARLEIGRKLKLSSQLKLVFLNNGLIKAVLNEFGIKASPKERFTISVNLAANLPNN